MKRNKNLVLIALTMLYTVNLVAQTQQEQDLINMKKYWFYHYRLVNAFMAKGDKEGESLPMGERAWNGTQVAKWGDVTIQLSQYIAVLATEYELLRQQSQPTDTTIQELYLAITAFNRLDINAEAYFANPPTNCPATNTPLNGFFMRDDVPSVFLDNHPKLKIGLPSTRAVNSVDSDNMASLWSLPQPNEMSVDQVYHLMVGFALVRKFIPPNTSWLGKPFADGETDIWAEVKNINDRIMDRLMTHDWIVYIPGTTRKVDQGWEAIDASYGVAEAACYIENRNSTPTGIPYPIHSCNEYHNFISKTTAPLWMSLGGSLGPAAMLSAEDYKLQSLAAIGNSWWTRAQPFFPDPIATTIAFFNPYNIFHPWQFITQLVTQTVVPPLNVTMPNLATRAAFRDNQHLPLLRQVLHGGGNPIQQQTYQNLLNTAPQCGPYNFAYPGNSSTYEWSADSRLYNSERRGAAMQFFHGEYNGIDYMLYYNLYHLIKPNTVPMVNYMDRVITLTFPDANGSGSVSNPTTIIAFNTITANNIVNNTGSVTYRAGNEIALKPGFSVKSGAIFHAIVQPFDCGEYINPTYRSMISNVNDTSNQSPTENLVAYTGQTTFVNYPKLTDDTEYINNNNYNSVDQNTDAPLPNNTNNASTKLQTVSGISIIPNPNNGAFQIAVTHNNQPIGVKALKVYDIMGKVIWSIEASTNTVYNIDISKYSSGIYYVRCINELGETETKKLIKE